VRWSSICRPRYQEKGGHYSPDKDCNERKQIALMILAMMHDLLYEQQTRLKPVVIPVWAKKIGLDLNKFGKDIKQGGVVEKRIQEDRQSGIRSGVNGTPTFYINGKRYDGSHDYDSLLAALESLALRSV